MTSFAPKVGCPLCSIVASSGPVSAQIPDYFNVTNRRNDPNSPPQIVWKDELVTAYLEQNHPVSSKGHIIIVLNLHVPSIYSLSSSDLPLLVHIRDLATTLLDRANSGNEPHSPNPALSPQPTQTFTSSSIDKSNYRVGVITSPFYDPKIPVNDHLHIHAYEAPLDLAGWWRRLIYGGMGWYAIDDLVAEIREQTSNNRIKSAYPNRATAPIDTVHDAGAKSGLPNGIELFSQRLDAAYVPSDSSLTAQASGRSSNDVETLQEPTTTLTPRPNSSTSVVKKPGGPRSRDSIALSSVAVPPASSVDMVGTAS